MRAAALPWLLLPAFAGAAWFLATFRFMNRWGAEEAALAAGLIVAFAIATTLWRWLRQDLDAGELAAGRCPRCERALAARHEHARTGALGEGLQLWDCAGCGYRHSEALTCPRCGP